MLFINLSSLRSELLKLIKRIRPAIILKFLIGTAFTISLIINLNQAKASDTVVQNKGAAEDVFWVFLPLVEKEIKDPYLRKVNAPYFSDFIPSSRMAVFWFGKITPTENYADVRVGYTDTEIEINLNIIDRHLWYNSTSSEMGDLANWDAVSLYVSTDPTPGALPASSQYKFVAQLNNWQPRESYQAAYQGTGTGWIPANISFSTESAWRGPAINNNSQFDDGWSIKFMIPFESVGFNRPPHGELWRLGTCVAR